jgi:aminoglycoside phosphotransferase (APT) family kinase protein
MRLDLRFLVPGPDSTVLLDGDARLPAAEVDGHEDEAAIVAVDAFLRAAWGFGEPVLETHPRWHGLAEGAPVPTLVTTEPAAADWAPPAGFRFGAPPSDLAGLPEAIRPRAAELLAELAAGTPPPELRPRWSRRGWRRRAEAWMRSAALEAGRPLSGDPVPFYLRGISALLRAPTAEGDVFLKAVFPVFHAEPVITKLLAERVPHAVPPVLGIEADEGWLLVGDVGSRWVATVPEGDRPAALAAGARTLVAIQQAMATRPEDLAALAAAGAPDRGLGGLAAAFAAAIGPQSQTMEASSLTPGARAAAVARVEEAVARLGQLGFPESLIHGDFHSMNAAVTDDGVVIIDWSDAAIGNPVVDFATWQAWSDDRPDEVAAATDAWIDAWSGVIPPERLRERLDDVLVAGAAYQVISYDGIGRGLEPATRYTMAGGGDHFLPYVLDRVGAVSGPS